MSEFRKKLTAEEIDTGAIRWSPDQSEKIKDVIPQTLVFDMVCDKRPLANLSVEWEKCSLFIGEPLLDAVPGSEVVLTGSRDKGTVVICQILAPQEKMILKKRLSHQEHNGRYLKWFAREDELYNRLFSMKEEFVIEIAGKKVMGRAPDFDKRKLVIGDLLRSFAPGDDLLIHWNADPETPVLAVEKEAGGEKNQPDGTTPLRSLVARLLSRPLGEFNEGEVKGLIVLLEENKKLWERIAQFQEENRRLKEQVNMIESLFEQFTDNSFFNSKKEFEHWAASHISLFEKGLRIIHRNYAVTTSGGKKRRIDILCQDKKGVLVVVQILFSPEPAQINEAVELISFIRQNIAGFGSEITGGQFKAADIRSIIIANYEKTDLVEKCLHNQVKLCLIKSGCLIDVLE